MGNKTSATFDPTRDLPFYFQKLEYETKNEEENILIRNVENCSFIIRGNCSSFTLENAKNTIVEMEKCVFGAAMVRIVFKLSSIDWYDKNYTKHAF